MERPRQTFERITFEIPQASDYFTPRGLQAMTGQPLRRFMSVVVKELLDNAIDACERKGVAPCLTVAVDSVSAGQIQITVADNGPGIPPDVARQLLTFETRTSDKAAYRSPTRGAQGNALKTVLGIPCALGLRVPLLIEAQAVRHTLHAWTDPAGVLHTAHDEDSVPWQAGTRVTITLPLRGQDCDLSAWGAAFALFNPHVSVKIRQGLPEEYMDRGRSLPGRFLPSDRRFSHQRLGEILAGR